jgi:hypothetical protein
MSKKNYVVDSKEMERLEKVNNRVEFLKNRILKDMEELEQIKESERWLSYLSEESIKISEEESYRLNEINENIKYATKNLL